MPTKVFNYIAKHGINSEDPYEAVVSITITNFTEALTPNFN